MVLANWLRVRNVVPLIYDTLSLVSCKYYFDWMSSKTTKQLAHYGRRVNHSIRRRFKPQLIFYYCYSTNQYRYTKIILNHSNRVIPCVDRMLALFLLSIYTLATGHSSRSLCSIFLSPYCIINESVYSH